MNNDINVDANLVITQLVNDVANLTREKAVLMAVKSQYEKHIEEQNKIIEDLKAQQEQ